MKALVVYDSRSGYTEAIARAIGEALEGPLEVQVVRVGTLGSHELKDVDLLVVGGPTEVHSAAAPMRQWLATLQPRTLDGVSAAAFDTRVHWPKILSGSAADEIAAHLREAGCRMVVKPESFIVQGKENPAPSPTEVEHAHSWARLVLEGLAMPVG